MRASNIILPLLIELYVFSSYALVMHLYHMTASAVLCVSVYVFSLFFVCLIFITLSFYKTCSFAVCDEHCTTSAILLLGVTMRAGKLIQNSKFMCPPPSWISLEVDFKQSVASEDLYCTCAPNLTIPGWVIDVWTHFPSLFLIGGQRANNSEREWTEPHQSWAEHNHWHSSAPFRFDMLLLFLTRAPHRRAA